MGRAGLVAGQRRDRLLQRLAGGAEQQRVDLRRPWRRAVVSLDPLQSFVAGELGQRVGQPVLPGRWRRDVGLRQSRVGGGAHQPGGQGVAERVLRQDRADAAAALARGGGDQAADLLGRA